MQMLQYSGDEMDTDIERTYGRSCYGDKPHGVWILNKYMVSVCVSCNDKNNTGAVTG